MTEPDAELKTLFTPEPIADDGFSKATLALIAQEQQRVNLTRGIAWLGVAALLSLAMIYFGLDELLTKAMTAPIIELDAGSLGWLLAPINNAGALLVALVKLLQLTRGRGRGPDRVSLLPF